MANENNIQLDLSINEGSINAAWLPVEKRAEKSAKDSAAAFENEFKKVGLATAEDFAEAFKAQSKRQELIPKDATFKAVNNLTDVYAALGLIKEGLAAIKAVGEEVFNNVLAGDALLKTENRFEALSASVGIVSTAFRDDLKNAVKGFVDDTDLLNLSSEAFIRLGTNAKELPRALEVARKAYAVFGGSVVENANKIISATETGATRTLKDIGLYTNLDGAVKAYAKQLGTIPALLTQTQLQQARLNAILKTGEERFSALTVPDTVGGSFTKLKVSLNQLNEEFERIANSKLGAIFKTLADYARITVDSLSEGLKKSRPAETINEAVERMEALKAKARDYQRQLNELGTGSATLAIRANLEGQLKTLKEQIAAYDEIRRLRGAGANIVKTPEEDPAVLEARRKAKEELVLKNLELNKNLAASETALAQQTLSTQTNVANLERLYLLQRTQTYQEYEAQKLALKKYYDLNGMASEEERLKGEDALRLTYINKALLDQEKYEAEKRAISAQAAAAFAIDIRSSAEAIDSVMKGAATAMLTQTKSIKASLQELGKSFITTFKTQLTSAIIAFAQGTKSAEAALHDFFNGLLNAFAEMLVSQGLGFILQGAALSWLGDPRGVGLMQAGAAMVAFGAGLAAVTGANGGAVGATGAGGGAAGTTEATTGTTSDTTKPIVETKPDTPKATINVNVGQVFDRRETGLWIADILSERFEQDGITVRSNA